MKKKKDTQKLEENLVRDKAVSVRVNAPLYTLFLEKIQSLDSDSVVKTFADCVEQMMLRFLCLVENSVSECDLEHMDFESLENVSYSPSEEVMPFLCSDKRAEKFTKESLGLKQFRCDFENYLQQLDADPDFLKFVDEETKKKR